MLLSRKPWALTHHASCHHLQDLTPPKDANVRVMVVRDHGSIALSHSACVPLVKGSVHNLKCSEAEHLVRLGVLRVLNSNC